MIEEQEPSPELQPEKRRPHVGLIAILAVAAVVAGAAIWWLLAPAPPAETPAAKAPTAVAAPAPAPSAPAAATEAPRPARPQPTRKTEAPAPTPAVPAAPATGELHIESDVPGAMVFLDRNFIGNAPTTASNVTPGTHHLNVSAEGYDGYSDTIEVAPGPADVMVKFREIRLNEKVDVVHKHAFGSCEGRLVADPQGIRYETTNKNDAFSMKWADIETFSVDYLKKTLVIKKRGGRQYNFTTKADNADPLFVFHRNVDKVRQQIMGGAGK
jgi:hypothetical protein